MLIAFTIAVVACIAIAALPQVYASTCKIFIQEGGLVTSSLASGREHWKQIEGTRGLEELILARDNLLAIVREAQLVDRWPNTRPGPLRLKDYIVTSLMGAPARRDMERGFVEMLSTSVTANKEGESVRIVGQWRDAKGAFDVARLVQRNFLAARAALELGPIRRAIPFLEQKLQEADQAVERAVNQLQTQKGQLGPAPVAAPTSEAASAENDNANELANLSRQLSDIRRQQRALSEPRRQRIAELKIQLTDMLASYSEDHPIVMQQQARIAALNEAPPELAALKERETEILKTLSSHGIKAPKTEKPQSAEAERAELAPLQLRLNAALRKSDEVVALLENARLELTTAEADFKHRYVVVEEAEVPPRALKEKRKPLLFGAALLVAILVGILAGAAREYRRGRLIELWQVRALGVELLGEVDLK